MAAGPIKILPYDGSRPNEYQLMKSLTTAQTALTAAKLCEGWGAVEAAQENHEVIGVEQFTAIRVQVWGVASDGNDDVLTITGWPESGPGHEIGVVDCKYGTHSSAATTGFHADPRTHKSIRDEYLPAVAYQGVDTYAATVYEGDNLAQETSGYASKLPIRVPATQLANYPGYFILSFEESQYKYVGMAVTTSGSTTCGAIFVPLGLRSSNISPTGY